MNASRHRFQCPGSVKGGRTRCATPRRRRIARILALAAGLAAAAPAEAAPLHYLFIGHMRSDDSSPQSVQRPVERLDFSRYDLLLGGGDYASDTTASTGTVAYLNRFLHLASPATLLSLGNHDTSHKSYFTNATARNSWYACQTNRIAFLVLDTTENTAKITGAQLQMVSNTVASLSNQTHLVLVHHHIIWLRGNPDLDYLMSSTNIAASTTALTTNQLNFYSAVYPLLLKAQSNGVQVICVAGDRTSYTNIAYRTAEGVYLLATGLLSTAAPDEKCVIEFEHDVAAGTLTWRFTRLCDVPRVPDDDVVISEIHYDPAPAQGDDAAFVELYNRGATNRDLSGAWFPSGIGFTFPTNTSLGAGQRLVIAANSNRYTGLAAQVLDWSGTSAPTAGAPLWLRDRNNLEIDYVPYGRAAPWPSAPSNAGPSLVLIDPFSDNELPGNWTASDFNGGTPGQPNLVLPSADAPPCAGPTGWETRWADAVSGRVYQAEAASDLVAADWQPFGSPVTADAERLLATDTNAPAAGTRFYRLRRLFW